MFSSSFRYKFIALLLAVLVWRYVAHQELTDVVHRVPLTIEVSRSAMAIVGSPVRELTVTFTVPKHMIRNFSAANITATHVVAIDQPVEQYTFGVDPEDIKFPPGLGYHRVRSIEPEKVTVRIDEMATLKLPIRAQIQGEPALGYKVVAEEVRLDPEEVLVSGPMKKLGLLTEFLTEPIDVVGRTRSFRKQVQLQQYTDIHPVNEISIDASIPIAEEFGSKQFEQIPIHVLGSPYEMILAEVEPRALNLEVTGPMRILEELTIDDLLIYVDVTGLKRGEHDVAYTYRLPQELSVKEELPLAHVKIGEVKIQ